MDALALMVTFIFVGFAYSGDGKPISIRKCCPKGMQLDQDAKLCVFERDRQISNEGTEILKPPINYTIYSWIPDKFRLETVAVMYGTLTDVELDVSAAYECSDSTLYRDFPGKIEKSLIKEERYCYDSTPKQDCVVFKSVLLKPIHKCCSKGETLNSEASACVRNPDKPQTQVAQEIVPHSAFSNLLTNDISQYLLKLQYNVFRSGYNFQTVISEKNGLRWEVVDTELGSDTVISYKGFNASGSIVSGSSDIFCFDEVQSGPLAPRVFLAAKYHVPKCCGKGEQLSDAASACQPWQQKRLLPLKSDILDRQTHSDDAYWLLNSFPYNTSAVMYDSIFKMSKYSSQLNILPDDIINKVEIDKFTNVLSVKLKSSKDISLKPMHYCFDYLIGSGRVIVAHAPKPKNLQCSFPEERSGVLLKVPTPINYPRSVYFEEELLPEILSRNKIILPLIKKKYVGREHCRNVSAEAHFGDASLFDGWARGGELDLGMSEKVESCETWELEGGAQESVASCAFERLERSFELVRQLGATAAAALAVAAAVVALAREKTRRLAHGRALACHALSLAAANILQVVAFYEKPSTKEHCVPYMYATYFFMVSNNFWLTAITYNIFQTFRLSLGEMAACSRTAAQRARFITMCVIGWGGAGALTAFAIIMHLLKAYLRPMGVITPSFLETRTCAYEFEFYRDEDDIFYLNNRFGSVSYHCSPTGLLAVVNLVLVVMTMHRLHVLRRGRSILIRRPSPASIDASSERIPTHVENALFYVKLLMTTGIVDLSMEAATWATVHGAMRYYVLNQAIVLPFDKVFRFAIISNIIDLLRALCVFWMSTGRFWRADRGWRIVKRWIEATRRRIYIFRQRGGKLMYTDGKLASSSDWETRSGDIVAQGGMPIIGKWTKISVK